MIPTPTIVQTPSFILILTSLQIDIEEFMFM